MLGGLDKVLGQWSNITKGQIVQRQAATDKLQKSLVKSGERLTAQYDTAYKRFLDQFTRLQVIAGTNEQDVRHVRCHVQQQ